MSSDPRPLFPFSAIVGQQQMKLALILNAINPLIGGVLVSGTRGTAKSTAVRALAEVLPPPTPFVNLPVGATEDRVLGTLDIEKALKHGERRFEPGLLAQAHNGVLYIDEVNLLPDHLVDVILDAVAMGVNRVEREGISHEHAANIILVGTMNPEEGELRPQLLDRFGLCANVESVLEKDIRMEAVQRRLAFDSDPAGFCATFAPEQQLLTDRIIRAREALHDVAVTETLLEAIVEMSAEAGADGLRADLSLHRAVRALASWEGRQWATEKDLEAVAELALAHRRRRRAPRSTPPQPPPASKPQVRNPPGSGTSTSSGTPTRKDVVLGFGQARQAPWNERALERARGQKAKSAAGRGKGARISPRGRAHVSALPTRSVAFPETLRTAGVRRLGAAPLLPLRAAECVWRTRLQKRRRLVVFLVDASGSMAALARMRSAKSAALALLEKAYQNRCTIALVSFRNESADVLLHPTRSAFQAFQQLQVLPAGGATPLSAGLRTASDLIRRSLDKNPAMEPFLILITDGRATYPGDGAFAEAAAEAASIGGRQWPALCIDTEFGIVRLGQTRAIAELLNAEYVHAEDLPQSMWAPIIEEWMSWQ